jgi:(1->4)-alpha-D-glucan 1-alpha-D-glucosylmutase
VTQRAASEPGRDARGDAGLRGVGRRGPEPVAAYRLQLTAEQGFAQAADLVAHLHRLGISHLYTSPVLAAAPGSTHGYDGVDPSRVSDELGGREGLVELVATLRAHGMGWLADIVPNHLSVAVPAANPMWWEVLRHGPSSPAARVFDVDWAGGDGKVVLPVLGQPLAEVVAAGGVAAETVGCEPAASVDGFVVPLRPDGPHPPPDGVADWEVILAQQHYRLVPWRGAPRNYRVFFDISSLAAVRVEDPDVHDAVHEEIGRWVRDGWVDGVRVDHVDGLARPGDYLERLRSLVGPSRWLVVEKILLGSEELPRHWPVDGTTGYEFAADVIRLLADPAGERPLTELYHEVTGDHRSYAEVEHAAKLEALGGRLRPDVARVARLAGADEDAVAEAAAAFGVYRTYLPRDAVAGLARVRSAFRRAAARRPDLASPLARLEAMVVDPAGREEQEVSRRFQQLTSPVMAKGAEDTAFYRYHRLVALNDVGADPGRFSIGPEELHAVSARRHQTHPRSLLTTSTHDTKRSEDVRARVVVLSELAGPWSEALRRWRGRAAPHRSAAGPDPHLEHLFWQTLVGAWPIGPDRLGEYLLKAAREAGTSTSWIDPDEAGEAAVLAFAEGVLGDAALMGEVAGFVADHLVVPGRVNALSQVLLRCTSPGVPDVYQGTERWDLSLVDPDNRRPVDWVAVAALVARSDEVDGRGAWVDPDDGLPKALLLRRALGLRVRRPELFGRGGGYRPLRVEGGGSRAGALAYCRGGGAVAVVPLRPVAAAADGWGTLTVALPPGDWRDVLCPERGFGGGPVRLGELFATFPVALLEREDSTGRS